MHPANIVMTTVALCVASICTWDVILAVGGNNDWTISWNMLGIEVVHPLFGMGLAISLMTLVGHLCVPHIGADLTGWLAYLRMFGGLLPVLVTFLTIAIHPQGGDIADAAKEWAKSDIRHLLCLWLAAAYGLVNGAVMVPQHP